MARTRRHNYDLATLAAKIVPNGNGGYKNAIIGTLIIFEDSDGNEVKKEVLDWHFSLGTREIHLIFTDGDSDVCVLTRRYIVEIEDTYESVKSKKKRRRAKKNIS